MITLVERFRIAARAFTQPMTGLGGKSDKTSQIEAKLFNITASEIDRWYKVSWLVRRICGLPSEELAVRWRVFDVKDGNESLVEAMHEQEKKHKIMVHMISAFELARKHGGAAIIPIFRASPLSSPLDLDSVRPGDLIRLHTLERCNVVAVEWEKDFSHPNFGLPKFYTVTFAGETRKVHYSRVARILPIPIVTTFTSEVDRIWGEPVLKEVFKEVNYDISLSNAGVQLVNEASIAVVKTKDFGRALHSKVVGDGRTIKQMAEDATEMRSVYRTIFCGKEDEVSRININFSALPEVFQYYMLRVAGAAQIPATILWGRSPAGENATGDSDLDIWQSRMHYIQKLMINPALDMIDPWLRADSGIGMNKGRIGWIWPAIRDKNAKTVAETSKLKMEAIALGIDKYAISEQEGREAMSGDDTFGELLGKAPFSDEMDLADSQSANPNE